MTTIRIKRSANGDWQAVELLEFGGGWFQVDDGSGSLWVTLDHVHPDDAHKITNSGHVKGGDVSDVSGRTKAGA
jgi:hypothetical protein